MRPNLLLRRRSWVCSITEISGFRRQKDTGTIEIIAPLSGEIVNIEDVPDVVFAEKIVVMALLSNQLETKWSRL
ncbi:glucose-specific PTS system EIIA component [Escherichia coli]|uniref:Glucose-specific PTS system EIIA component n=1 Tax=Escherichia coli TaxID=562 RepID=A0A377CZJ0_ECOLX|nr:glucose-specific PTS system EIIA component [Escherichia coli]